MINEQTKHEKSCSGGRGEASADARYAGIVLYIVESRLPRAERHAGHRPPCTCLASEQAIHRERGGSEEKGKDPAGEVANKLLCKRLCEL